MKHILLFLLPVMLVTNLSTIKFHVKIVKVSLAVTEHCIMTFVLMSICIFSKLIVEDCRFYVGNNNTGLVCILSILHDGLERLRGQFVEPWYSKICIDTVGNRMLENLRYRWWGDRACTCGTILLALAQKALTVITNICLNNYCKKTADRLQETLENKKWNVWCPRLRNNIYCVTCPCWNTHRDWSLFMIWLDMIESIYFLHYKHDLMC